MILSSVLLPQPDGPTIETNSPGATSRLHRSLRWFGPEHDPALHQLDGSVQDDADRCQDDEQREDGGDLEIGVIDQQQIAESAARADELADDSADYAEHDADIEPGEDERQRSRQPDHGEGLPAARL
jgi:hypothetical protein